MANSEKVNGSQPQDHELTRLMDNPVALAYTQIGSGPSLLLVHGSGTDGTRWTPVVGRFAARFAVHVVDRRGHGKSADRARYRIEDEFDDLAAMLDEIGDPDATVIGHSYGALCALGAAVHSTCLARLVLYEPPLAASPDAYCPPGLIGRMREAIARDDLTAAANAFAAAAIGLSEADIERQRKLGLLDGMTAGAATILRELESVSRYATQARRFASCRHPTLLLVGAESPPEYHATANTLAKLLSNSGIRLLERQGHRAIDTAPELFVASVLEFFGMTTAHQSK